MYIGMRIQFFTFNYNNEKFTINLYTDLLPTFMPKDKQITDTKMESFGICYSKSHNRIGVCDFTHQQDVGILNQWKPTEMLQAIM